MGGRMNWRRARSGQRINKADEPHDWLAKSRAHRAMRKWLRTLPRRKRRWLEAHK